MLDTQTVPFSPAEVFTAYTQATSCETCSAFISGAEATDNAGNCEICASDFRGGNHLDATWLAAWDAVAT